MNWPLNSPAFSNLIGQDHLLASFSKGEYLGVFSDCLVFGRDIDDFKKNDVGLKVSF